MAVYTTDFEGMLEELGDILGYTLTATSQTTLIEGKRWINKGLQIMVTSTLCLKSYGTFDSVDDQAEYDLNDQIGDDFILIDREGGVVYYDSTDEVYTPLEHKTITWLDENRGDWRSETKNDPEFYYELQVDGVPYIGTVPKMDEDGTDNVKVFYFQRNEKLVNNSDAMEASIAHYYEVPILYAYARAKRKENEVEEAKDKMNEFIGWCNLIRKAKNYRPNYRPPNIEVESYR